MEPFVRNPYNYDMNVAGDESGLECKDVSLAKQSFAEEVDINTIVRRFGLTGQLPDQLEVPQYADFESIMDFHTAMIAVRKADEQFMTLPGEMRARFNHNPQVLLEFLNDEKNREEAVKLGLVKPAVVAAAPIPSPAPSTAPKAGPG